MFCNKCGRQLPEGSVFCSFCGARLGSVAPVESVNVPTAILTIRRAKKFSGSMQVFDIVVDGNLCAKVRNGENVDIEVPVGRHSVIATGNMAVGTALGGAALSHVPESNLLNVNVTSRGLTLKLEPTMKGFTLSQI